MESTLKRTVLFSELPSGSSVTFPESSFFSRNNSQLSLPTLAESLGLVIKCGRNGTVSISEGQCLWALRHYLPELPVPEIYGWSEEGGYVLLYMELIHGDTVGQRWDSMNSEEKPKLWGTLQSMHAELRTLRPDPQNTFLGNVGGGPYHDISIPKNSTPPGGPFASVHGFHNWLSVMIRQGKEQHWPRVKPEDIPDPYRCLLPDDVAITFTHSDLHPSNIMVDTECPSKIVAIIDWKQLGSE
ncbi:kinase-like domain-containing protein [Pseudomassariella vexata]|uniref:Kinase-like domain-containing protein n=1 Tax=Pseudomassariella vexata TaxID=1141098 RepID=A0A1Y2EBB4_9PEZI|nr:kinase-like domain-containing protein [Pseudomassariella vexata]ORY68852.1 kinase-like domain-containing protein [Pseudomassariella vexata]